MLQIPYTGCPTAALVATANKLAVKEASGAAGLPTPDWIAANGTADAERRESAIRMQNIAKFILKSVFEHASFEIDDASIVRPSHSRTKSSRMIASVHAKFGRPFFAERFIDGREFNLSVFGAARRAAAGGDRFFGVSRTASRASSASGAKWDAASFEFHNTPRRFDFPPADGPLVRDWNSWRPSVGELFELRGYARVDFRCDAAGQPWILEINTNPCLRPTPASPPHLSRPASGTMTASSEFARCVPVGREFHRGN